MPAPVTDLLADLVDTSLAYFLEPGPMSRTGLPLSSIEAALAEA